MSGEIHGYLRDVRNSILSQIEDLRTGKLEVWDAGIQPRQNVSGERIVAYESQLAVTEELMRKFQVPFDS